MKNLVSEFFAEVRNYQTQISTRVRKTLLLGLRMESQRTMAAKAAANALTAFPVKTAATSSSAGYH